MCSFGTTGQTALNVAGKRDTYSRKIKVEEKNNRKGKEGPGQQVGLRKEINCRCKRKEGREGQGP